MARMSAKRNMELRHKRKSNILIILIIFLGASILLTKNAWATDLILPSFHVGVEKSGDPGDVSVLLQIVHSCTGYPHTYDIFHPAGCGLYLFTASGWNAANTLQPDHCRACFVSDLFHYDAGLAEDQQ